MLKLLAILYLVSSLNAISFPFDASDCSYKAKQLRDYADELESAESALTYAERSLDSAKSDYEFHCGSYGTSNRDESMCGQWGMISSSYEEAINDYNSKLSDYKSKLSDVNFALRNVLNNCQ